MVADAPVSTEVRGVACDLLTALVDSWGLWERVAGDPERGRRWRQVSLRMVTSSGAYRPHEAVVSAATEERGPPAAKTTEPPQRGGELEPCPDARPGLA